MWSKLTQTWAWWRYFSNSRISIAKNDFFKILSIMKFVALCRKIYHIQFYSKKIRIFCKSLSDLYFYKFECTSINSQFKVIWQSSKKFKFFSYKIRYSKFFYIMLQFFLCFKISRKHFELIRKALFFEIWDFEINLHHAIQVQSTQVLML